MITTDKKAIAVLSTGHFAVDLFASAIVPLYPYLVDKLGITLSLISLIIALGHLLSSMLQPLFGFYADKTKHRFFMFWGLFLASIFIPLAIDASSVKFLTVFFVLGVAGNALFHPQVTTMISAFNEKDVNLSKYMGIFLGSGTIGYAFAPMVSSAIVEHLGSHWIYIFSIFGIFCAFFLYFFVPKIPGESISKDETRFSTLMKEIFSSKKMLNLTLISVVKSLVSMTFATYFPFILIKHGFTLAQTGIIVTLFFAMAGFATMASSKIEKKIGVRNLIKTAFLINLPLSLACLYALNFSKILSVLIFVFAGFFVFLSVSVTIVLAQRFMPEHKGVVSGVTQGFSWGLAAICIAPLGYLAQNTNVETAIITVGVISFIIGFFFVGRNLEY